MGDLLQAVINSDECCADIDHIGHIDNAYY